MSAFKTERMENRLKQTTAATTITVFNLRSIKESPQARHMGLADNLISWETKTVVSS